MLGGLMDMEEGDRCCHLSVCSILICPRSCGMTKWEMRQGEGGKQGDVFMPLLFSLGQHGALRKERLLAFLDDLVRDLPTRQSASSPPNRGAGVVGPRQDFIAQWQDQGVEPGRHPPQWWSNLQQMASKENQDAVVWRSDMSLPRQRLLILDTRGPR